MWIGGLGPRMFWGTRATNFSIYTTKMKGAGPQILGTGVKFKRVPRLKNCRVNRAKFAAWHPPFLSCKWKNSWHECPKTYGCRDHVDRKSRPPYVLGHSCHEFFHLHDKNEGCRAANCRHRGQIQTGTVPKKLSCKPG